MMRPTALLTLAIAAASTTQAQAAALAERVGAVDKLLAIGGGVVVVLVTLYCIKCFLRPGERNAQHIKRRILKDEW